MFLEADAALIERAKLDRAAFGDIYDLYVNRVYAFSLARSQDRAVAEDLTSQTFERALSALPRYQSQGRPFSAWLFRIAANLATDQGRRSSKFAVFTEDETGESSHVEPTLGPEESVIAWERAAELRAMMANLPADQQQAVRLRYWEGLSVRDAGERLGRNENATKQLLHRALQGLRAQMDFKESCNV